MSDHVCLTGCAHTYREARQLIKEKERLRRESQAHEELIKERKPKSFCISKLGPVLPDPLEGTYRQFQLENYDSYMEALGAGKMSRNMILRSTVVLQINEELDKRWKISFETTIKAKSMKGFSTATPKLVENKFALGEPTKELLEDWDCRTVESVLELHDTAGESDKNCCLVNCPSSATQRGLVLCQTADKNKVVGRDSMVIFSLDKEDPDVLIVVSSCRGEDGNHIVASRRFRRCQADQRQPNRRVSVI